MFHYTKQFIYYLTSSCIKSTFPCVGKVGENHYASIWHDKNIESRKHVGVDSTLLYCTLSLSWCHILRIQSLLEVFIICRFIFIFLASQVEYSNQSKSCNTKVRKMYCILQTRHRFFTIASYKFRISPSVQNLEMTVFLNHNR